MYISAISETVLAPVHACTHVRHTFTIKPVIFTHSRLPLITQLTFAAVKEGNVVRNGIPYVATATETAAGSSQENSTQTEDVESTVGKECDGNAKNTKVG